jgi:hypothetical protein
MSEQICSGCKYFYPIDQTVYLDGAPVESGECRRRAVSSVARGVPGRPFPVVRESDWCGEWEAVPVVKPVAKKKAPVKKAAPKKAVAKKAPAKKVAKSA